VGVVNLNIQTMRRNILAFILLAFGAASGGAETFQGVVSPIKSVSVSSPVLQEIITDVVVKEGATVKESDVIVELRKEREELDVKLSDKLIELKRFIARGQEKLFKEEMGSEEKALEARTDLELAQLQLEAKKVALREKTIRAPLSGIVVKKYKESGESVAREEKLVDIVNIDQVFVRFYLPPNLRKTLKEQEKVSVKIGDLEGAEFSGIVTFVDPRNDAASGLVQVKVEIENKDHRIKPGMKGSAEFGK
jgi:membrane fusion protein, multidrug efflux system